MRGVLDLFNLFNLGLTAVVAVLVAQSASAVTYDDARRFIEAEAEARCCSPIEEDFDDPPAIDVMGPVASFDDTTMASAAVSGASGSATSSQVSVLGPGGVEASGSYLAEASANEGDSGFAGAINDFSVTMRFADTGQLTPFTLTGMIENFDAANGSIAGVYLSGPGVFEFVEVQDETQTFDISGSLDAGQYDLVVDLQGQAVAMPEPPPLGGDPSQSSNGSFDLQLTLPEPGVGGLFAGIAFLAAIGRRRVRP